MVLFFRINFGNTYRWDDNVPHQKHVIHRIANNFPDTSLTEAENFCRNPASQMGAPWCYTLDPKVIWESCDVPKCSTEKVPGTKSPISS